MSATGAVNPFVPGRGHLPPFLAGRQAEQEALNDLLAYLKAGRGAPRDAILAGPRGNGKTALLRWFHREIEAAAPPVDAVWLTPSDVRSLDQFATAVVPPGRFTSMRPDTLSFTIGIGRLGWELGDRPAALAPLLKERCKTRPLVLLLDEAHTLDPEVGQTLLNASQSVSAEAPFLLVMAGTPGLQAHLNTMSATFWSRGEKLGIDLLDEAAAAQALVRPLAAERPAVIFDDPVLHAVVKGSQRYPYFVQLWGAALWKAARDAHATRVDEALVSLSKPRFDAARLAYYEDRREELTRQGVLGTAVRLARAFGGNAELREDELDAAIAGDLPAGAPTRDVHERRDDLARLGYVWKPPGAADRWRPGIPSLMDYVVATADGTAMR